MKEGRFRWESPFFDCLFTPFLSSHRHRRGRAEERDRKPSRKRCATALCLWRIAYTASLGALVINVILIFDPSAGAGSLMLCLVVLCKRAKGMLRELLHRKIPTLSANRAGGIPNALGKMRGLLCNAPLVPRVRICALIGADRAGSAMHVLVLSRPNEIVLLPANGVTDHTSTLVSVFAVRLPLLTVKVIEQYGLRQIDALANLRPLLGRTAIDHALKRGAISKSVVNDLLETAGKGYVPQRRAIQKGATADE